MFAVSRERRERREGTPIDDDGFVVALEGRTAKSKRFDEPPRSARNGRNEQEEGLLPLR